MTQTRAVTLNALSLYAVALVLTAAFAAQFMLHELPCPLCLLQRILFATLAVAACRSWLCRMVATTCSSKVRPKPFSPCAPEI